MFVKYLLLNWYCCRIRTILLIFALYMPYSVWVPQALIHFFLISSCSYTSVGSIYDTVPNKLLSISNPSSGKVEYRPAYMLADGRSERAGRARKSTHKADRSISLSNGTSDVEPQQTCIPTASVIGVGDEILWVLCFMLFDYWCRCWTVVLHLFLLNILIYKLKLWLCITTYNLAYFLPYPY